MTASLKANADEAAYIQAMSRNGIVSAYARWSTLSGAEHYCFTRFINATSRVLDLGCGTGRAYETLKGRVCSYVGVDASERMVEAARNKYPDGQFMVGDIIDSSVRWPEECDVVLLLHNVIDMVNPAGRRAALLERVYNALPRNGMVIASSHLRESNGNSGYCEEEYHGAKVRNYRSSFPEWCSEVESHGFSVVVAMRDYRGASCDWAYVAATKA